MEIMSSLASSTALGHKCLLSGSAGGMERHHGGAGPVRAAGLVSNLVNKTQKSTIPAFFEGLTVCCFIASEMIATTCRVSYNALSFTNKPNHATLIVQFGRSIICCSPEAGCVVV